MNSSCPICLDVFEGPDIAATPCGHVFHCKCIYKWLDNSEVCPECSSETLINDVTKLFINFSRSETLPSYAAQQSDLDCKNTELTVKLTEIKKLETEAIRSEYLCRALFENICELDIQLKKVKDLELETVNLVEENSFLKNELKSSLCMKEHTNLEIHKLLQENRKLKSEIQRLRAEKRVKVKRNFNTKPSAKSFLKQWKEYTKRQKSIEEDRKRLVKYSMDTGLETDMIVDSPAPDYTFIEIEAQRVASEAIKALKESIK